MVFYGSWQADSNSCVEGKSPGGTESLEEEGQREGFALGAVMPRYKAVIIKTLRCQHRDRQKDHWEKQRAQM